VYNGRPGGHLESAAGRKPAKTSVAALVYPEHLQLWPKMERSQPAVREGISSSLVFVCLLAAVDVDGYHTISHSVSNV